MVDPPASHLHLIPRSQVMATWGISPGGPWVTDLLAAASTQLHACSRSRLVELTCALAALGVRLELSHSSGCLNSSTSAGSGSSTCNSSASIRVARGIGSEIASADTPVLGGHAASDGADRPAGATPISSGNGSGSSSWGRDEGGGAFVCAVLRCFASRRAPKAGSGAAPLPRHVADLAVSLAQLCCPLAPLETRQGQAQGTQGQLRGGRALGLPREVEELLRRAVGGDKLPKVLGRLPLARRAQAEAALRRLGLLTDAADAAAGGSA